MVDLSRVPPQCNLRSEAWHTELTLDRPSTHSIGHFVQLPQVSDTTNISDRLQTSFSQVFGQLALPLLGAVVILFAGYLIAKVLEKLTERLLRRIRLNYLLERGGVTQAVERSGTHVNPTRVIANLVFWLVMFTVILLAANALGLQSLANVVSTLVSYIPSVIAAIVIVLIGIVLGGFVGGLIQASTGGLHGGRALARTGRGGVILLAVFMALQQLGIATDIVTTAFAILFGAIALAMALAFGLGNRELAAEVTREWYERWRREREELLARERAAEEADAAEIEEEERAIARATERDAAARESARGARGSNLGGAADDRV
jgi:mechanosensitive ion channel-like protein